MKDTNNSKTTTAAATTATPAKKGSKTKTQIGTAITALAGMLAVTHGKRATGKEIACRANLETAGVILSSKERIETGYALSKTSYRSFVAIAAGKSEFAEGARTVVELTKKLFARGEEIRAYHAAKSEGVAA